MYNISVFYQAVMIMIVWYLGLQLPMQAVSITTKVVSLNPAHSEVYSIQHYVIEFVSGFFPATPPIKLTATI